jgi:hypothetical protein
MPSLNERLNVGASDVVRSRKHSWLDLQRLVIQGLCRDGEILIRFVQRPEMDGWASVANPRAGFFRRRIFHH